MLVYTRIESRCYLKINSHWIWVDFVQSFQRQSGCSNFPIGNERTDISILNLTTYYVLPFLLLKFHKKYSNINIIYKWSLAKRFPMNLRSLNHSNWDTTNQNRLALLDEGERTRANIGTWYLQSIDTANSRWIEGN